MASEVRRRGFRPVTAPNAPPAVPFDHADSILSDVVRLHCAKRDLQHRSLADGWLQFIGDSNDEIRVAGFRFGLNSDSSSALARDKARLSEVLRVSKIPCIAHQPLSETDTPGPVVVKPRMGSGGRGVKLWVNAEVARAEMHYEDLSSWVSSPYVPIEREIRLVVLDGNVMVAYEKTAVERDGLMMHNVAQGGGAELLSSDAVSSQALATAEAAISVVGLRAGSIDLVTSVVQGDWAVMEVNDGVMLEGLARSSQEGELAARSAYSRILTALSP